MSEMIYQREERHWKGVELAFESNTAYDRWREEVSQLLPYLGREVESAEWAQMFMNIMDKTNECLDDFVAYCTAAGALLLDKPPKLVTTSTN